MAAFTTLTAMTTALRTTPFPVAALRFIDDATSGWNVTLATSAALKLYGDASAVMAIKNRHGEAPAEFRDLLKSLNRGVPTPYQSRQMRFDLGTMANDIIRELPPPRRAAIVASAYPHLVNSAISISQCCASWAFEDERIGGAMLPYRRKRARVDRHDNPTKRVARRLHAPSWIRRYVKNNDSAGYLRDIAQQFLSISHYAVEYELDPADLMMLTDDLEHVAAIDAQSSNEPDPFERPWSRWIDPSQRKVMRKSAEAAASIVGDDAVSALLRGEHHDIVGPEITYRVRLPHGARGHGHGQLSVTMIEGGRELARLCVYVPKTPALDQVAAIALHAMAGEDREVLDSANIIEALADGVGHPLVAARRVTQFMATEGRYEREHRLQREYFARTQSEWLESTFVFVFGPKRAPPMLRMMAAPALERSG